MRLFKVFIFLESYQWGWQCLIDLEDSYNCFWLFWELMNFA